MADETREDSKEETVKRSVSEGLKQGLGALSAVRGAIEETISDAREQARERDESDPDRAKSTVRRALDRAQVAALEARERFDFPRQKDFDILVERVAAIERHLGIQFAPVVRATAEERDDEDAGIARKDPEEAEPGAP